MQRILGLTLTFLALPFLGTAQAAETRDPLASVPDTAQVFLKIEKPRALVESITGLSPLRDARAFPQVRAVLESSTARRLFQMLAHLEAQMGATWPQLLDQVAGGGIVIASTYGADPAPILLVVQGTDEKQSAKAFDLIYKLAADELTRQGANVAPPRSTGDGFESFKLGDDFMIARTGTTILASNKPKVLEGGLKLASTPNLAASVLGKKSVPAARKLLPKDPLAWVWIDFESVKQTQSTKDFFAATRQDFLQTLVVGSTIDCVRRSEFVSVGLYQEPTGFRLALRLPAGRSEFPEEFALHVPTKGEPGSLPLLEPPGVLYSQSFYLDIGYYWKHRDKLIGDEMRKQLEQAERDVSKVLPGSVKIGELLEMWGPHHRVVVVNQDKFPYKTIPSQRLPAFGYATSMRNPEFGKSLEPALRSAALIASIQFGMKMVEIEYAGVKIVAYRFSEDKPLPEDPEGLRFNFEFCFAVVGDQLVAGSTIEVCKKVIDEVKRTAKLPSSPAVWRGKGYAVAAANALAAFPEPLVTDAILEQGVGIEDARKQVDSLVAWLKTLGTVRIEIDERETEYRFDLIWDYRK